MTLASLRRFAGLILAVFALVCGAVGVRSWLNARDDRIRLAATLAAQQKVIDAANGREASRVDDLRAALAQIAALKRATRTPQEILRALPQYLPLPQPIAAAPPVVATGKGTGLSPTSVSPAAPASPPAAAQVAELQAVLPGLAPSPSASGPKAPDLRLPAADLKPLFDFVQDCRATQLQLHSCQLDLADEKTKAAALTAGRDAAVKAAKGGGIWTRTARALKWIAIGAGAGAAAICATGHCK